MEQIQVMPCLGSGGGGVYVCVLVFLNRESSTLHERRLINRLADLMGRYLKSAQIGQENDEQTNIPTPNLFFPLKFTNI